MDLCNLQWPCFHPALARALPIIQRGTVTGPLKLPGVSGTGQLATNAAYKGKYQRRGLLRNQYLVLTALRRHTQYRPPNSHFLSGIGMFVAVQLTSSKLM